jgi:hypothetical protein
MEPLQRQPLPCAADVALEVMHGAGIAGSGVRVCSTKESRLTAWVVVVNSADIETEVAKGLLVATVEIHLEVAARKARALANVRVPVTQVDAARVAVIEPALDRRLAKGLVDATEPVFRDEGQVTGDWRGRRGGGLLSAGDARGGCRGGERQWNDVLTHLMLSLKVNRKCRLSVSISYATHFLLTNQDVRALRKPRRSAPVQRCVRLLVLRFVDE